MLGPVSQFVVDHVRNALKRSGLVVWFDPEGVYANLLPELHQPNWTVVPFEGGYYEQRSRAEEAFVALNRATLATGHAVLLYVPRPRAEATPLLEFTLAGVPEEIPLVTAAHRALAGKVPVATLDQLLSKGRPSLADLDALGAQEQPSMLRAIFGTASESELVVRYLTESDWEGKVDSRGALPELISLCSAAFGLPAHGLDSHAALKDALPRHLLLSEFRWGLSEQPPALAKWSEPSGEQYGRVTATLNLLRERETTRDFFVRVSRQVEREARPESWGVDLATVQSTDTFPFIEATLMGRVQELVLDHKGLAEATGLLRRCLSSFWVRAHGDRLEQWQAAALALEVCREAQRVAAGLKAVNGQGPDAAVLQYARPDDGWWRLDAAQRRLEFHVANMDHDFALEGLLHYARDVHERAVQAMAERFEAALQRRGFHFGSVCLQTDVYARYVEPLLSRGERVAYLLVDALRFEMGRELHETVVAAEKNLEPCIATPPTVTQVGMAALLPGAQAGVSLAAAGGKLGLEIDRQVIVGSGARKNWFLARAGGTWVADYTLDDLSNEPESKLKKALDKKSLLVVRSKEIDAQGEEDNRTEARRTMTGVLKSLRRAIERLARLGFGWAVVTADHGYLFGQEYGEDRKVPQPSGQKLELHRRCWVGRHATPPPQAVHFKASDLGLGGDLELVFPRGLAIFDTYGSEAYFHGGLTLQELVIPVLTLKLPVPARSAGTKGAAREFELKPTRPKVTNRMFAVQLTYYPPELLAPPERTVRVVAMRGDQEVGRAGGAVHGFDDLKQEVTLLAQKANNVFLALSPELEGSGQLSVQVINPQTGLVLEQLALPYELL